MTLENYIVRELPYLPKNGLTGRRKILTTVNEITEGNVREVLEEALAVHSANAREITWISLLSFLSASVAMARS